MAGTDCAGIATIVPQISHTDTRRLSTLPELSLNGTSRRRSVVGTIALQVAQIALLLSPSTRVRGPFEAFMAAFHKKITARLKTSRCTCFHLNRKQDVSANAPNTGKTQRYR